MAGFAHPIIMHYWRTILRFMAAIQLLPALESGEETLVGGQAVMEGVMMRAPHSYCVAVRKPNGELVTSEMPIERMSENGSPRSELISFVREAARSVSRYLGAIPW